MIRKEIQRERYAVETGNLSGFMGNVKAQEVEFIASWLNPAEGVGIHSFPQVVFEAIARKGGRRQKMGQVGGEYIT